MSECRAFYTISEDRRILRYILDRDCVAQIMGNNLWKQMEKDSICPERTWQSLKNRFRRHIMPFVTRPEYNLKTFEWEKIKAMSKAENCETCHSPIKKKPPANSVSNNIVCGSSDERRPATTSHTKPKTVAEQEKSDTS